jgi:hypothetical protein
MRISLKKILLNGEKRVIIAMLWDVLPTLSNPNFKDEKWLDTVGSSLPYPRRISAWNLL